LEKAAGRVSEGKAANIQTFPRNWGQFFFFTWDQASSLLQDLDCYSPLRHQFIIKPNTAVEKK
jgi:hypothetical protein